MKKLILSSIMFFGITGMLLAQKEPAKKEKADTKVKVETVKKDTKTKTEKSVAGAKGEEKKAAIAKTKEAAAAKPEAKKTTTENKTAVSNVKKDGTPDKRFKENKNLKKDGTPDKRFKENKKKE